ncbi:SRPBCC family protein [Streptomyces sp. NPDC016626]|uniref:SRPBCC family protein n=1 Tax=Streptomyces sp. NPDC016626 TaxID=3364968 RepID=UPI003701E1D5
MTGTSGTTKNPLADVAHSEAAERLKAELQDYLAARAASLLTGLGHKLGETTNKLSDIAEGRSPGFAELAAAGGRKLAEGKGPLRSAVELGASRAKDKVKGTLKGVGPGGRRKGSAGRKPTVIIEHVDVGVPLRTAYDQWTRYQDFSTFAKGVKSVDRADDTTSDWQVKVFWSSRSWRARTTEQIPDDRIAWSSEGAKGTTKGVVSFHRLADSLTRVLLVIEYYPTGLFEKTGNIWRAQGRRARLDLKNFARFITLKGEAEDSWRGEIRDGEVVRGHEDASAEENEASGGEDEAYDEDAEAEEPTDEYAEDPEAGEHEEPTDEYAEDPEAEEAGEPAGEYEEDEAPEESADEYEEDEYPDEEYEADADTDADADADTDAEHAESRSRR